MCECVGAVAADLPFWEGEAIDSTFQMLGLTARIAAVLLSGSLGLLLDRVWCGQWIAALAPLAIEGTVFGFSHWLSLGFSVSLAVVACRFRVIGLTGGIASGKVSLCHSLHTHSTHVCTRTPSLLHPFTPSLLHSFIDTVVCHL